MKNARGITLIEVLIAILLLSGGLLGVVALQAQSLKMSANAGTLSLAVKQASNMVDRMQANPQAVSAGHYNAVSGTYTDPGCGNACTPQQLAQLDAFQWVADNASLLHSGLGTVTNIAGTNLYTVALNWTERGKDADVSQTYRVTFMPYQP